MKYKTGKVIKTVRDDKDIIEIANEISKRYDRRIKKDRNRNASTPTGD